MKTYNHTFETKNLKKNVYELITDCPARKQMDYSSIQENLYIVSVMKIGSQQCQKCNAFGGMNFGERLVVCKEDFDTKELEER